MSSQVNISDTRCVYCGHNVLKPSPNAWNGDHINHGGLICQSCFATNDIIDGVPFFGGYDHDDFIGLIEVVATAKMNIGGTSLDTARLLHTLLHNYHHAENKEEWLATHPEEMVRAEWFSNHRYHEWLQVHSILSGRDLNGKKLLNVGAGTGSDSAPLLDAGALVTCIDYSPTLVGMGAKNLPEARWVGGFSHILPFQDESFDIVGANAALHHFRSVPAALREMLRVLKPGGLLFTVDDPIRADNSPDDLEFQVFDRHEGVLSGINEGIFKFSECFDTINEYAEHLEIALIVDIADTSGLEGLSPIAGGTFNDCWVPCWENNIKILRERGGGLGVAIKKKNSFAIKAATQSPFVLPPGVLSSWLENQDKAFSGLMAWAPKEIVNLPFPGEKQSWFELLNGWMMPQAPFESRTGYARARWLVQQVGANKIAFDIKTVIDGDREFEVIVDGKIVHKCLVNGEWSRTECTLETPLTNQPTLIEIRFLVQEDHPCGFDGRCFVVRNRLIGN